MPATEQQPPTGAPRRQLSLVDATAMMLGIIIGSGLYETSPLVAQNVGGPASLLGLWLLGGGLALVGALCYAELATAYPRDGGDFVYLTRAFGRPLGFLYAWASFWIVKPGSIGSVAYIFARYAEEILPLGAHGRLAYAAALITLLTLVNILGVRKSAWTENLLALAKVGGLATIVGAAFLFSPPAAAPVVGELTTFTPDYRLALVLVVYAYGGWNDIALVAAEVRNPRRNLVRALLLGTCLVALVYVLVNAAFLRVLGFDQAARSGAIASDVVGSVFPSWGPAAIALLICISTAGSVNGMIFTAPRIYYAVGAEHAWFAPLGRWHSRFGTPVAALVSQGVVTLALVVVFGMGGNEFARLVVFTTPVFFIFFALSGVALLVLRRRAAEHDQPFRAPGGALTPLVFILSSLFMLHASLGYALEHRSWEAFWAIGLLVVGAALAFASPTARRHRI